MVELLAAAGTEIDDAYYCFHAPTENCKCRKPQATLVLEATEKYHLDLAASFIAGDKPSDLKTGRNADHGIRTILVGQKEGEPLRPEEKHLADLECPDLLAAAEWIAARK